MFEEVVRRKSVAAGSLDGWGWRELKVLPAPWFDGLARARVLFNVEETGVWPEGLVDAYIAMIPKTDGDATPLGQRPLSVLSVVYRIWARQEWCSLKSGSGLGSPARSLVLVVVVVLLRLGTQLLWISRSSYLVQLIRTLIYLWLTLSSHLTLFIVLYRTGS